MSTLRCQTCGVDLTGRQRKFCGRYCQHKFYREQNPDKYKSYHKQKRAEQRQLLIEIKLEKGCAKCGYKEHPAALDFNHLDPSKKSFRISSDVTTKERLLEEVAKCEVLCANCHRIHTYDQHHYTLRST